MKNNEDSTLYQPVKDVIFLSGGANIMPNELYSNFLNNMASSNFRIYLTDFTQIEDYKDLIELIESNNVTIVFITYCH